MDVRVHATTVEFCFAVCCAERRETAQSVTSSGDPPTETWQQPHAMGEISEATTVEFCFAVSSADRRNTESISVTSSGDSPAEAWQQPHQKGERPEPRAMTQTVSKGFHSVLADPLSMLSACTFCTILNASQPGFSTREPRRWDVE